jgi:hypothetical protein
MDRGRVPSPTSPTPITDLGGGRVPFGLMEGYLPLLSEGHLPPNNTKVIILIKAILLFDLNFYPQERKNNIPENNIRDTFEKRLYAVLLKFFFAGNIGTIKSMPVIERWQRFP